MADWARGFGDYVATIAGGVGVALIAALILLALSRVTLPTLRPLWHRASPLGRLFGTLLFLICSINATTKAPTRTAPKRVTVSVVAASQSQSGRIEKWFRRGAWRDDHYLKFDTDWVFPHGTNHYSGIWIYSWGKLAAPRTRQAFAALGTDLALFPEESEVTWERTESNSYRIAWQNGFPDRRSRENGMSASFELFRNGDIAITTNDVTRYIERELPFDCSGRGQDAAWVAANYPNGAQSIVNAGGYNAWVDGKVGVGLENGLYRFTATFPTTPLEAIELFVGPYTVAVTNAGDYVFLLEKGRDYNFGTRPFIADVTYSAVDDLGVANNLLRSASGWRGTTWNTAGCGLEWTLPTESIFGNCCWLPYFKGAPDLPNLSLDAFPSVFEGVLSDTVDSLNASYEWRTDYNNLEIKSPNERETEVSHKDGTDWKDYNLSVTATLGKHKLTSSINGHFWTNSVVEETSLTVSAPKVLLLPSNAVKEGRDSGVVTIDLNLPEGESGTLSLECVSGADKVQLSGETSWKVNSSIMKEVRIVGKRNSFGKDDVKITVSFISHNATTVTQTVELTVIDVWHKALALVPEDNLRTCFGVGERVAFQWRPAEYPLDINFENGTIDAAKSGFYCIEVAHRAGITSVNLAGDEVDLSYELTVIEPEEVVGKLINAKFSPIKNLAGGIDLTFKVFVKPLHVSFDQLEIQELPRVATDATGYFAQSCYADLLDHGKNGAGTWMSIRSGNYLIDLVGVVSLSRPWLDGGAFTWPIPCEWRLLSDSETVTKEFAEYTQRFELDANGTVRIKKFGYCAERTTNAVYRIPGGSL